MKNKIEETLNLNININKIESEEQGKMTYLEDPTAQTCRYR
jgi:hypothetical protein